MATNKSDKEEKVMVMIPFIEGQDPEVTVIINGHISLLASVLENSNEQMMAAWENQQALKYQKQDL